MSPGCDAQGPVGLKLLKMSNFFYFALAEMIYNCPSNYSRSGQHTYIFCLHLCIAASSANRGGTLGSVGRLSGISDFDDSDLTMDDL